MKWDNLKNNKCPDCNKDFTKGLIVIEGEWKNPETGIFEKKTFFIHKACGFKIREERYKEIVSSTISHQLNRESEYRGLLD